jgi:peptidyl-prolyl cis-trans isomerase SurA
MNRSFLALGLACAAGLAAISPPLAAQGLRPAAPGGLRPPPAARAADAAPQSADYIVAVVNSEPITNNEVRIRMMRFERQLAQQGTPPPKAQLMREVLERLISEKAQLQLAREQGVKVDDALVDQAEQNVARQNQVDVAELRRRMVAEGMVPAQFRQDLRDQLLLARLRERELEARVRVTEREIDQFLAERGGGEAITVTQSRARHILLRPGPQLTEAAARQRLADFKRRIEARQADFAQLAREHSQDASGPQGGELGWANPGTFVPEFEDTLNSLAPGQIADPITSRFGVHLVQLVERRQAALDPRERREVVRNVLRERKLDEAYATWAQEVRGRAYVEYREPPQ